MNLADAAAAIDAATAILQQENDRAERIEYWRKEVARLAEIPGTKPAGVERRIANIRLGHAEFALLRLTRERDEALHLAAEERAGMPL